MNRNPDADDELNRGSATTLVVRRGRTIVLTGWRAWLVAIVASFILAVLGVLLFSLWIGVFVALGVLLLIAIPLAIVIALIGSWTRLLRFE